MEALNLLRRGVVVEIKKVGEPDYIMESSSTEEILLLQSQFLPLEHVVIRIKHSGQEGVNEEGQQDYE